MREGPQPPACVLDSCDNPPANGMVGYCATHERLYAASVSIVEPDDPALLERTARAAAAQEEKEYAERRRVKSWKTLENGSRVPEEYWSDEELEAIEARVALDMNARTSGVQLPVPADPEKAALKILKRALRGRYGPGARRVVEGLVELLEGL